MSDISTGHIYIITCTQNPNIFYIGSTFNQLRYRMQGHKNKFKAYMNGKQKKACSIYKYFKTYGIENFNINLIKSYKVIRTSNKDCKHLHMYEQLYINKFKKCCNEKPAFNPLFYDKTIISDKKKTYRTENIEKVTEQKKISYHKNKNLEQRRVEYDKNKEKINEQRKAYREKNREKINEQKRANREINKEKINEQQRASYHRNKNK